MHTFSISPKEQRVRLDHYLTQRFSKWSRMHLKRLIEDGFVLVGGAKKKAGYLLHGGDEIQVLPRGPERPKAVPEAIPLAILYEDDSLIVLNKPAGLVVHPAAGHWSGTLVNALLHHATKLSEEGGARPNGAGLNEAGLRPGIVHRLDKGTSGVMVVAKTNDVHRSLAGQFKHHKIKKIYHAIVHRPFQSARGTFNRPIGRDPKHRLKFSSQGSKNRDAVTEFKVMQNFRDLALLELSPQTGRTHQLRVHLSEAKHPIVGDVTYGANIYLANIRETSVREAAQALTRPALHAYQLGFTHPVEGRYVEFTAPWPEDFQKLMDALV